MKKNFDTCLKAVLAHEGGYVNHPSDPGGMTNLGVTKKVWEEWTGKPSNEAEMRSLTPQMVAPLYQKKYWDAIKGDDLPSGVDMVVFDCAVNSGPGRAIKFLQSVVGVTADGSIGPKTIAAVQAMDPKLIVEKFNSNRLAFMQSLSTFSVFGKGWTARVNKVGIEASRMI